MIVFNLEKATSEKCIPFQIRYKKNDIYGILEISTDEWGEQFYIEFDRDLTPQEEKRMYRKIIKEYKKIA